MLFIKLKYPDGGEFSSFYPDAFVGIVLRRNTTHLLVFFPYQDESLNEYIWFERPRRRSRTFWDTIYSTHVEQVTSSHKERLQTWRRIRGKWDEVRAKGDRFPPPARSSVNTRLMSRFAVPPPVPAEKRKPPKARISSSRPRLFVQGGLPELGKRR